MNKQTSKKILRLEDLPDPGSARVPFSGDAFGHGLCVVRKGEKVFAYMNRCPHTGGPMDWIEGRFLTQEGDLIMCSTHGARFRIEDGSCLAGPCAGQYLTSVPVEVSDGNIKLLMNSGPDSGDQATSGG